MIQRCGRALCPLAVAVTFLGFDAFGQEEAAPAAPRASQPVNRPFAARRVVFQFDFEPEPQQVFKIPRYWEMAQDGSAGARRGFPAWNSAQFDGKVAYSGSRSVKLTTKGGSVCLRLQPGVIPVFPGTDYLVSARVQTRGLSHARAGISVRYLDKANAPISGSESRSELISTANGEWKLAVAPLSDQFKGAAYVQIDLEVLQPEQVGHSALDQHQVWPQDFAGDAFFDQVAVVQLPKVAVKTSSPLNIIRAPERPLVSVAVRDLTGEDVTGHFFLQDAAGQTVDSATQPKAGGSSSWDWEPKVSRYGWFRATLELRSNQRRVGATYVDFVWLPANLRPERSRDWERFSIILSDLPKEEREHLPGIIDATSAGAVTIPIWAADSTPKSLEELSGGLVTVVERLGAADRRISFSLPRIPDALANTLRLNPQEPLALLATPEKEWDAFLTPFLDKYGQSVQRWQVGSIGAEPQGSTPSAAGISRLNSVLSRLVPGPVIEVPWPADVVGGTFPGTEVTLLTTLPRGLGSSGVADLAASWSPTNVPTVVIEPLDQPAYSRMDSCDDLVKRAVQVWAIGSQPPNLAMVQPWEWPSELHLSPMPKATFAAWANLVDRLHDRRVVGSLTPAPGVNCVILGPAPGTTRTGALVVWASAPQETRESVDLYLGEGVVDLVDTFGNRSALEAIALAAPGRAADGAKPPRPPMAHRIPVSDAPLFVENVDVDLAMFAAAFHLDPSFAASSQSEHEISMVLTNPWKTRIEGQISVLEPGGLSTDAARRDRSWRITPRTSQFNIGPGETAKVPLMVAFSGVEEAGPKDFLVEIELAGTKDYAPIRLHTPLEVGVADFQVDLTYQFNGPDLRVEATVTNRGRARSTYEMNGFAEGYPRAKAHVSDLPPGAAATRQLIFPGGVERLKGQKVSVNIQDFSTQSRINRSVAIE